MAVAAAWFASRVVPICVQGALLCAPHAHSHADSSRVGVRPHHAALPLQRDVLQLRPILTLTGQSWRRRVRLSPAGPPSTSEASCVSLVLAGASDQLAIKHRFPDSFLGVLPFARRAHRILGNTYLHLLIYYVIKAVMKEADDQPEKERWGEVWRGLEHRGLCPQGAGMHWPLGTWTCSVNLEVYQAQTLGIFMAASSRRHNH